MFLIVVTASLVMQFKLTIVQHI